MYMIRNGTEPRVALDGNGDAPMRHAPRNGRILAMAALKEHGRNREAVGMRAQDAAARVVACSHPASKFEDRQETAVGKQEAVGRLLSEWRL